MRRVAVAGHGLKRSFRFQHQDSNPNRATVDGAMTLVGARWFLVEISASC
jgi:hypothetical protein